MRFCVAAEAVKVISMQRFLAELSSPIEKVDFEKSWRNDCPLNEIPKVEFAFQGRRISVLIYSDLSDQWPSASFHRTFSETIRRLDAACNVRWL